MLPTPPCASSLLLGLLGTSCASAPELIPDQHERPIVEEDGRTLPWADEGGWFDVTESKIDPPRFQHGIGKDTIEVALEHGGEAPRLSLPLGRRE